MTAPAALTDGIPPKSRTFGETIYPAMWELVEEEGLTRTFKFNSFIEAFAFMTKVALTAEKLNHHPTFINTYGEVIIRLGTHDAGGDVTDKDHFLAAAIDNIYGD